MRVWDLRGKLREETADIPQGHRSGQSGKLVTRDGWDFGI